MFTRARAESLALQHAADAYTPLRKIVEVFLGEGTEFQTPIESVLTRFYRDLTDPDRPKPQSSKFFKHGLRVTAPDGTLCSVIARTDPYGDQDAGDPQRARIILSLVANPGFPDSEVLRTLPPVHAIGKRDNLWGAKQLEYLVEDLQEIPALLALADE